MNRDVATTAEQLRQLLIEISPLIEEYTAALCPACRDVCCKQRHGTMNDHDLRYLAALGAPLPVYDPSRHPDGACQFMGSAGCVSPRWLRPWRCTWYFCEPLLKAVDKGPQKKARTLSSCVNDILILRNQL